MTAGTTSDVVIVGAGAAGVAAARHLADTRPDLSLQILEAGHRLGGRARTTLAAPGLPLDLGCGWLHGARDNIWREIAERLGFALDDTRPPWDGSDRHLDLDAAEKAAAGEAMERYFAAAEARGGRGPDVAMSAVLEPSCRWNGMIDATGTFINGAELADVSLADYANYEPGRGPDRRVRDGYGRLVETFGASLPVRLETVVHAIDHTGSGIRLDTNRGTLEARTVIVTVSTTVLAQDALRFTPALPHKQAAAAALPLGVANKLFLRVPDDVDLEPETFLLGSAHRTRTAAYHIRPFGRPVIECYFGGALARDMERDRDAALAFVRDELSAYWNADVVRRLEPLAATAWAAEPFIGGSYSYARPGQTDQRQHLAAPVDDRLFFAGEACSRHRFSTAHGAFETGIVAAKAASAALRQ